MRNIGVYLDSSLTMDKQVNAVSRACYYQIRNIGYIRQFITIDTCKTLVNSLITSRLNYDNALLYGIPKLLTARLQGVQNSAARYPHSEEGTHHSSVEIPTLATGGVHTSIQASHVYIQSAQYISIYVYHKMKVVKNKSNKEPIYSVITEEGDTEGFCRRLQWHTQRDDVTLEQNCVVAPGYRCVHFCWKSIKCDVQSTNNEHFVDCVQIIQRKGTAFLRGIRDCRPSSHVWKTSSFWYRRPSTKSIIKYPGLKKCSMQTIKNCHKASVFVRLSLDWKQTNRTNRK